MRLDLEVLQADFVRMETETETAEAGAVVTLKLETKSVLSDALKPGEK